MPSNWSGEDCSMRVLHKREACCQMSAQDTEIVLTVPAGVQFLPSSYLGHTQLFHPAKTLTDLSWVWRPEHVGLTTDSTQTMWWCGQVLGVSCPVLSHSGTGRLQPVQQSHKIKLTKGKSRISTVRISLSSVHYSHYNLVGFRTPKRGSEILQIVVKLDTI